jgi:hypothetical protein
MLQFKKKKGSLIMIKKGIIFFLLVSSLFADSTKKFACEMYAVNYIPISDRQKESFGAITNIDMTISNIKAILDWKEDATVFKYMGTDPKTNFEFYVSEDEEKMFITPDRSAFFIVVDNSNLNYRCK